MESKAAFLQVILQIVSDETGVPIADIASKRRLAKISDARRMYCHAACEFKNATTRSWFDSVMLREIGEPVNIDHCTVIFHTRKSINFMENERLYAKKMRAILMKVELQRFKAN